MKPSSQGNGAKAGPSTSKRQANGRLPQAPSSLLVQLPPDELRKYQESALQSGNISGSVVQASDVHLLAGSIQERRDREARVFKWQQKLIDADKNLPRDDLKRALTQLSLSSWLQVLQERHLDGRCAYPSCSRKSKKPHLSSRHTILPQDAPRYRISLGTQSIRRDERDDPGGENGYCSKACWRRGEWISRWVLEGMSAQQSEKEKRKAGAHLKNEGPLTQKEQGLGREVDEGGRWERQIEVEDWEQIEILEDLEDRGEIDRLSDDEQRIQSIGPNSRTASAKGLTAKGDKQISVNQPHEDPPLKSDLDQFSTMLKSLTIIERANDARDRTASLNISGESKTTKQAEPTPQNTVTTSRFARPAKQPLEDEITEGAGAFSDADSDDLDVLGELSLRGETGEDVISTILQSSRHLQRTAEEEVRPSEMTEEERRRLEEEDDLFALARQARDEEKAKGSWVD